MAAIATLAMFLSLTVAFGDGLLESFTGGSIITGGILCYASGGVMHLPYINLIGAFFCVFTLPRATGQRDRLPAAWMFILTGVLAYFAMTFIDIQQVVKTAMLRAQDPFVTAQTLLAPTLTWVCVFLFAYARAKMITNKNAG